VRRSRLAAYGSCGGKLDELTPQLHLGPERAGGVAVHVTVKLKLLL